MYFRFRLSEAATRGVLWKTLFLEVSQNSQENTCATVSFLLWHRCFPVNFGKFLRKPFLQINSGRLRLDCISTEPRVVIHMVLSECNDNFIFKNLLLLSHHDLICLLLFQIWRSNHCMIKYIIKQDIQQLNGRYEGRAGPPITEIPFVNFSNSRLPNQ